MAAKQELQVQQKREIETKEEATLPTRTYVPTTDIFETQDALNVVLEMPGVEKTNIDVTVQEGILNVEGRLDFSKYKSLQPLYTEYNVGNYVRQFTLNEQIDESQIKARMKNGVLEVELPKREQAKPRRIEVSAN